MFCFCCLQIQQCEGVEEIVVFPFGKKVKKELGLMDERN
jgi:hypothetical protein